MALITHGRWRSTVAIAYIIAYIDMMNAMSITELRKNLAAAVDRVTADHDYTIITREGGKPAAVLMSLEDFSSWQETDYLLRSPANREALLASIAELDAGGGRVRELIEE